MKLLICGLKLQFIFSSKLQNSIVFENLHYFFIKDDKTEADYKIFVFKSEEHLFPFKILEQQLKRCNFTENIYIKNQFYYFFTGDNKKVLLFIKPEKVFFNNFLRIFLSSVLINKRGFFIHASAVLEKNKAYIFSGLSGTGKTTIAKKFSKVYSDDIIGVRKIKDSYKIFPTPFWGDLKISKDIIELKPHKIYSLFFIEKNKLNSLKKINKKIIYKKLLRNVLFFGKDIKKIIMNVNDFVNCNIFYDLQLDKKILKNNFILKYFKDNNI